MNFAVRLTLSTPADLFTQENVHTAIRKAGGTVVRMERAAAPQGRWTSTLDVRLNAGSTGESVALAVMGVPDVVVKECTELSPAWQPTTRG